jgi:uncharacterized protein (TIGR01777 family)
MRILIIGGVGFVGSHLSNLLLSRGHTVTAVGRRSTQALINHPNFHYISADTSEEGPWQEKLTDFDAVFNLAGKTIFNRWSDSYKKLIYDSRILTTRNLVAGLPKDKEVTFISTSATGYYGNRGDDLLTEDASPGDDFLAKVGKDWESEAYTAEQKGIRVITARFGVVLGKGGGAMEKMIPAFRFYVGGPLGNGLQWFPWIHMDDLLSAFLFILENQDITGPVNFCAPNPVRNRDLAKAMGRVLKRPSFMPAPAFMIRLIAGEFGNVLLYSQRAVPEKLLSYGFSFQYPDITAAIENIAS